MILYVKWIYFSSIFTLKNRKLSYVFKRRSQNLIFRRSKCQSSLKNAFWDPFEVPAGPLLSPWSATFYQKGSQRSVSPELRWASWSPPGRVLVPKGSQVAFESTFWSQVACILCYFNFILQQSWMHFLMFSDLEHPGTDLATIWCRKGGK